MEKVIYMTRERIKEIEEELNELKGRGRRDIAQKIAEARSHGDLSENAEYDAAKEAQGLLETKIAQLSNILANSQIIDPSELPNDKIYILSKVKLKNTKNNSIIEYLMVSPQEADYERKKLSVDCPLGKALMGKTVGEVAEIKVPAGITQYEILEISR